MIARDLLCKRDENRPDIVINWERNSRVATKIDR